MYGDATVSADFCYGQFSISSPFLSFLGQRKGQNCAVSCLGAQLTSVQNACWPAALDNAEAMLFQY